MNEPCHGVVFRDVTEDLITSDAIASLRAELRRIAADPGDGEALLSGLLRAGEMESALADAGNFAMTPVTDCLAAAVAGRPVKDAISGIDEKHLDALKLPEKLTVSRPEGFAYYGVHPLDFRDAVKSAELGDGPAVVIGIRSIGTTLSAVVAAALRLDAHAPRRVVRLTVRPSGHPYDRTCDFPEECREAIEKHKENAAFVIVDEGPGLSGSSFLAVGEALVEMGVSHKQVLFAGSREVDPANLVTRNGRERWKRFKFIAVRRKHLVPEDGAKPVNAGAWRKSAFQDEREWPGIWTTMCPAKYWSADGKHVFEYQGLGRYGDAVRERGSRLAEGGYALPMWKAAHGYSRGEAAVGRWLTRADATPEVLEHLAAYLAFRANHVTCAADRVDREGLENMARFNLGQALGEEYAREMDLYPERPVIADGCMMPYRWVKDESSGRILKLNAATDGDNHFFPGPVDIAWDIAGTIAEWRLDANATRCFVDRYERLCDDDVMPRLRWYQPAYCAFRNAYCRMAAAALAQTDPEESARLLRDAAEYAEMLVEMRANDAAAVAVGQE